MLHLIIVMDLVLILLTKIYFFLVINSKTLSSSSVLSFVSCCLDILQCVSGME